MSKIHVEYSQAVFTACVTLWGPVREDSLKELDAVQVSMVDERCVLECMDRRPRYPFWS